MYVLQSQQGQFSGFHFLILFLKTLKLDKFLQLSGRMSGYTLGLVKYRPNKRSGKLTIELQIIRLTIFLFKNIADYRW